MFAEHVTHTWLVITEVSGLGLPQDGVWTAAEGGYCCELLPAAGVPAGCSHPKLRMLIRACAHAQCYQNKNNLMAGIIVAGWDADKGGQVFALPLGGAMIERPYTTGGAFLIHASPFWRLARL